MKKLKNIILIILITLLCIGSFGLVNNLVKNKDTTKITSSMFTVGAIDKNGDLIDSKTSFVSKKIGVKGLSIVPEFDSKVSYFVYYYDDTMKYLSRTNELYGNYDSNLTPTMSKFCKIVVFVENGEKATVFNKSSWLNKLDIRISKNQQFVKTEATGLEIVPIRNRLDFANLEVLHTNVKKSYLNVFQGATGVVKFEVTANDGWGGFKFKAMQDVSCYKDIKYVIIRMYASVNSDTLWFNDRNVVIPSIASADGWVNYYINPETFLTKANSNSYNTFSTTITKVDTWTIYIDEIYATTEDVVFN